MAVIGLPACGQSSNEGAPRGRAVQATKAPAPLPEREAGPLVEDPTFALRASEKGPYRPGSEGHFEVQLTPRGGYHVNQEYPISVEVTAPTALAVPTKELGSADAEELTEDRARFSIAFTPNEAGEYRVLAEVDFGVCTPETCLQDRRTLALMLPVESAAGAGNR